MLPPVTPIKTSISTMVINSVYIPTVVWEISSCTVGMMDGLQWMKAVKELKYSSQLFSLCCI